MINKPETFKYIEISLVFAFKALTEMEILSKERPKDEIIMVNNSPFKFYRVSLKYVFVMELTKLLNKDVSGRPKNHVASLIKASNLVKIKQGTSFNEKYQENLDIINLIKESDFYNKIITDRDGKLAHADLDHPTDPLSFTGYTEEEIKYGFKILEALKIVYTNCTNHLGYDFHFQHKDNRLDNFIAHQTLYKDFFSKNIKLAYEQNFYRL